MLSKLIKATVLFSAVAVAAGVAYAAIPSANGMISACKGPSGQIQLIDKEAGESCVGQQQLVEWNQQGPQGPAGPAGPAGPSNGYVETAPSVVLPANPEYPALAAHQTVASLALPAGKYIVWAKARIFRFGTSQISCLLGDAQSWDPAVVETSTADPFDTFTLIFPADYADGGTVTLRCASDQGGTVGQIRVAAIKVGTLTTS
jgi:hypothetical protein